MEIRITGWGYENIRRLNTLDIDLLSGTSELPHTTLVMMKNGTGKTTTLHLMRATLSGTAIKWSASQVKEFKPVNATNPIGKFYVKVIFGSEKYRYTLILDYDRGSVRYETSNVGLSGGLEDGHRLPLRMRQVLNNEGFVERFVFDGEQAKKTLNAGNREAELAVWYLYQIDKLEGLKEKIKNLVQKKQSESDSKGATSVSLSNNRTRRDRKKKNYENLETTYKILQNESINIQKDLENLEKQKQDIVDADTTLKDRKEKFMQALAIEKEKLLNTLQLVNRYTRLPYNVSDEFNQRLTSLMKNMQTLKLPKTTAREFFKELSESTECVCGREIGPNEKKAILQRAELYLGAEDLNAINAIKDKLKNYVPDAGLTEALKSMTDAKEEIQNIQSQLNRLLLELDPNAQRKAEEIQQNFNELLKKAREIDQQIKELEAPSSEARATEQNNLTLARKGYEEAEEIFLRAQGTYKYTKQAEILLHYIRKTETSALEKLKADIIKKTNEKIAEMIPDEQIVVDKIEGSLVLHDRSAVSEGQTLAIAYSYIGSLFEHSSYEFPFVIDSPAASMDLDVRREVASIIPKLFKQLIIFVTSGEVAGFAEKFYSTQDTKYLTIEGQGLGENAICTEGQTYFSAYQIEEE